VDITCPCAHEVLNESLLRRRRRCTERGTDFGSVGMCDLLNLAKGQKEILGTCTCTGDY
jgi:hypothetical protein